MKDSFKQYHPIVNFTFFVLVIGFSMISMNPIYICMSIFGACVYSIMINGASAVRFNFLYMLPMAVFVVVINVFVNHRGKTILMYVNDMPITYEAVVFGLVSSAMFFAVIIWFTCYNAVMTSDKVIYLFGRVLPTISLLFTMILRFVPTIRRQILQVSNAQKGIGKDVSSGKWLDKLKHGAKIISIVTTWTFENSITTADSMRSRGYGLSRRTHFSTFKFDVRDGVTIILISIIVLLVVLGHADKYFELVGYFSYFILMMLPVGLNILEDIRWRFIK